MNWKFWKARVKVSLGGLEESLANVYQRLDEMEARLSKTEATAIRVQSKVYRDINAGVVYPDDKINTPAPLTNYGPGDMIPENTQWG